MVWVRRDLLLWVVASKAVAKTELTTSTLKALQLTRECHAIKFPARGTPKEHLWRVSESGDYRKLSAIALWRTFSINTIRDFPQSSDVIEPDMNTITCFMYEEYIIDFKSRKVR